MNREAQAQADFARVRAGLFSRYGIGRVGIIPTAYIDPPEVFYVLSAPAWKLPHDWKVAVVCHPWLEGAGGAVR